MRNFGSVRCVAIPTAMGMLTSPKEIVPFQIERMHPHSLRSPIDPALHVGLHDVRRQVIHWTSWMTTPFGSVTWK